MSLVDRMAVLAVEEGLQTSFGKALIESSERLLADSIKIVESGKVSISQTETLVPGHLNSARSLENELLHFAPRKPGFSFDHAGAPLSEVKIPVNYPEMIPKDSKVVLFGEKPTRSASRARS